MVDEGQSMTKHWSQVENKVGGGEPGKPSKYREINVYEFESKNLIVNG